MNNYGGCFAIKNGMWFVKCEPPSGVFVKCDFATNYNEILRRKDVLQCDL